MSDLTDATGPTDSPAETAPPVFDNAQTDAILSIIAPLLEAAVAAAVEEAAIATPVPTFRPGTCTAVDAPTRTCQVLLDGDDETVPGVTAIQTNIMGENPVVGGRVMVVFSPPSNVHAISMVPSMPAGMIISYAGLITADSASGSTQTLPPPGFLRCYGQVVAVEQYSALYAAIGTTFNTGGESPGLTFRLPDLRGRAIVGLDNMGGSDAGRLSSANTLGTTMGAETVTISTANMPSHTHSDGTLAVASHSHDAGSYSVSSHTHSFSGSGSANISGTTGGVGDHSHSYDHINPSAAFVVGGGGEPVANGGIGGYTTGGAGSHSHSFSGSDTVTISGTTGSASPGLSGSSGSSAPDVTGSTGSAGSGTALNVMGPSITLHWCIKY